MGFKWGRSVLLGLLVVALVGCAEEKNITVSSCTTALSGTSWIPSVSGASSAQHDGATTVTTDVYSGTGELVGLAQGLVTSKEITMNIDMSTDLGDNGSLTLDATVTSFPSSVLSSGSAYPVLVSLNDGVNELVNLARAGGGSDCVASGLFSCTGGVCTNNDQCTVNSPSAFVDRRHWLQNNVPSYGYSSTNTFPTCNSNTGTPTCNFGTGGANFFNGLGKLRSGPGVTYVAKYILVASNYSSLSGGLNATLQVNAIRKKDTSAVAGSGNGAIDLNVILVGTSTIQDSRTDKGKQNLDAMLSSVQEQFNQSGTGIRLGTLTSYEWTCENGGDGYSQVSAAEINQLFQQGSALLPSSANGKAVNLFVLSSITNPSSNGTILGLAGAIGGPIYNGTGGSGFAVATFGQLDTYNPNCNSTCTTSEQESQFRELASTVSHEMGHYLGLNHLNESNGATADPIADTPECSTTTIGGQPYVTVSSCLSGGSCSAGCSGYNGATTFCPSTSACQFNHMMWWTSKNFEEGTTDGDGQLFSTESSAILNYHPLVY